LSKNKQSETKNTCSGTQSTAQIKKKVGKPAEPKKVEFNYKLVKAFGGTEEQLKMLAEYEKKLEQDKLEE
jgi:hypothetical protein